MTQPWCSIRVYWKRVTHLFWKINVHHDGYSETRHNFMRAKEDYVGIVLSCITLLNLQHVFTLTATIYLNSNIRQINLLILSCLRTLLVIDISELYPHPFIPRPLTMLSCCVFVLLFICKIMLFISIKH